MHAQWETDRERASEREREREWERVRARRQSLASAESHIACELPKCVLHFYLLCFPFLLSLSHSITLSLSFSSSALLWLLFSLLFMLNVLNVFQLKIVATDCSGVPFLGIIDFETCNNNNITNVTNCFFVLCFYFFFCVFLWINFVMQSRRVVHGGGRMWHVACAIRLLCGI